MPGNAQDPFVDSSVVLRDGRRLGYAEFGAPGGVPLLWFPGLPGCCRYASPADAAIARRNGVRLVCVERPGFGVSDFLPGRRILDYPDDVAQLADALGFERFFIAGASAGGPSLAACAHALPDRVIAVGMIGCGAPVDAPDALVGMAPTRRRLAAILEHAPWLADAALSLLAPARHPERLYNLMLRGLSPGDLERVRRPEVWTARMRNIREAFRQGTRGFVREVSTFLHPWGFPLGGIRVPVYLWHGEDDRSTPIAMGRYLAEEIPGCQARFLPGEGHFLCYDHFDEILRTVTSPRSGTPTA